MVVDVIKSNSLRHPGEGRDPLLSIAPWIPAFAGMTMERVDDSARFFVRAMVVALFVFMTLLSSVAFAATNGISARFSSGAMVLGPNANACNGTLGGAIRFTSATGVMDFCNATNWTSTLLSPQTLVSNCVVANRGAVRYNTTGSTGSGNYPTSNYVEICNGTTWVAVNPPSAVAGSSTQILFNNNGVMAGSPDLIWNESLGTMTVGSVYQVGGNNAFRLALNGSPIIGQTAAPASLVQTSVAIGRDSLAAATGGSSVAIGYQSMPLVASGNTAVGARSCYSLTTGYSYVCFGWHAGYGEVAGGENVIFGSGVMSPTGPVSGGSNVAIGSYAMAAGGAGFGPIGIGRRAYYTAAPGGGVAIGALAFSSAASGGVAVGSGAFQLATGGTNNGIGAGAGVNITGGADQNLIIGGTNSPYPSDSYMLNIGNFIYGSVETGQKGVAVGVGVTYPTTAAFGFLVKPPATETITAGATITVNACGTIKSITATGAVSTSTTNTFTAPATANDGCCMDLMNVGNFAITLKKNTTVFMTSGGADVVLDFFDMVRVCSTGTAWYQMGPVGDN